MSPQYTVKHDTDWSGNPRTVIRESPTGAEMAGTALGMALVARQKALQRNFSNSIGSFDAAVAKGEFEQALKIAEGLASNSNRDIRGAGDWLRSRALRYLGRPEEAVKAAIAATQALEASSDPDAGTMINYAQCELGWASLMIGNAPTAITAFTRAIKIVPEDQEAFNGRGIALRYLSNYEQSLRDLDRAIQISPGEKDHYLQRGLTYLEVNNLERAVSDFTQVVRLAPDAPVGYRYLAQAHLAMGDHRKAVEYLSQAVTIAPQDSETRRMRASAYQKAGEQAKADADLAMIEVQEQNMAAFGIYRNAAQAIYDRGVTKYWQTPGMLSNDTKGYRMGTFIAAPIVLVGVLAYLADKNGEMSCIAGVLGLAGFFAFWILLTFPFGWFFGVRSDLKKSRQCFDELTSAEQKMPGFTEFYRTYLDAREKVELAQLEEKTRHLFEEGGAARKEFSAQASFERPDLRPQPVPRKERVKGTITSSGRILCPSCGHENSQHRVTCKVCHAKL